MSTSRTPALVLLSRTRSVAVGEVDVAYVQFRGFCCSKSAASQRRHERAAAVVDGLAGAF
jgi:hypothetical protein